MRVNRTLIVAALTGLAALATNTAAHANTAGEAGDFRFPGADTLALHNGSDRYVTYGAGHGVPFSVSGHGSTVGSSSRIKGHALPHGAGPWATPKSDIWTPGAFYHVKGGVGRYYLFYTATRADANGEKCIGYARSRSPFSGFRPSAHPLICPPRSRGRWALDADVTTGPHHAVWITWRDGQRAIGAESALSAAMLRFDADGTVVRNSTPTVIMRSNALSWAHYRDNQGVTVIENPSAFYRKGSWYLFYSGNSWPTNYYSTGIAYCGARIDDGLCTPMPGPQRAYFSYSGPKRHLPARMRHFGLPGNKRGPGAMDVYRARGGQPWVTWNYLSDAGGRRSRTGRLMISGMGRNAVFRVVR